MDPLLAANILFSIWDLLHRGADESGRPPDRQGGVPAPVEGTDRFAGDYVAMHERMDRLVLVTHAMWTVVADKMGVTEADLLKRLTELDAADGTVDGEVTQPPVRCSCGAMVCRKLGRCLFCGKPYGAASTFDTL